MELAEEIRRIAEERLSEPSQFIVDVIISARSGPQKVLVVVDGDQGITIDDCANISRDLAKVLDELPLLNDRYVLEVSTPGLDQPLKLKRQYKKNVGRKLRVKLQDKIVEGQLLEATDEKIIIGIGKETGAGKEKTMQQEEIQFSEIDKSFVLVSFK